MQLLTFVIAVIFASNELDEFLNKDIKIYFSGYPTYVLGVYSDGQNLVARSKYVNFGKYKFSPKSRIIKNGKDYELFFSGKRMCRQGNVVSVCTQLEKWSFVQKIFGYNIVKENKCITKGPDDTILLKQCTESDDQLFSLKSIRADCDPAEEIQDKHSVHVNVYPNPKATANQINIIKSTLRDDSMTAQHIHDISSSEMIE